jgi:hypothetical protein
MIKDAAEREYIHIRDVDEYEVVNIGNGVTMYYGSSPFSHIAEAWAKRLNEENPHLNFVVNPIPRRQGKIVQRIAKFMRRFNEPQGQPRA